MTDLIVVPQATHWQRLKRLVLDSVSSPISRPRLPVKRGSRMEAGALDWRDSRKGRSTGKRFSHRHCAISAKMPNSPDPRHHSGSNSVY
jgi:hypothetical protein